MNDESPEGGLGANASDHYGTEINLVTDTNDTTAELGLSPDTVALIKGELTELEYLELDRDFGVRVKKQVEEQHVRTVARTQYDQMRGHAFTPPLLETLREALAREREQVVHRIEHLMVRGHNTTIAAAAKVGKTTLLLNRIRSLVDGDPFLESFDVLPVEGNVVVFNYEVGDNQFIDWLKDQGIKNVDKVIPVNLRGLNYFIQRDDVAEHATKLLRDHDAEVWEFDPLSAGFMGNMKDEEAASDFIARAERIKHEAGVVDFVLTTHTGHLSQADANGVSSNERSAGSARWMGWPDAMWTYVKKDDKRYLSAFGRDVECDEFVLRYDSATRRLSDGGKGTNRAKQQTNDLWVKILRYVEANPGITTTALRADFGNSAKATSLKDQAVAQGLINAAQGTSTKRGPKPALLTLSPLGQRMLAEIGNVAQ